MPSIYKTISWRFYKHSEKVKSKCKICGKTITKTISVDYREDSKPDMEYLEEQKQAWLSKEHVCSKCLKSASKVEQQKDITDTIQKEISELGKIRDTFTELRKKSQEYVDKLSEKLKGKILIYKDKEYCIYQVCSGWQNNSGCELHCYKIDEHMPWTTTNKDLYVSAYGTGYSNFVDLRECIITDEDFSKRAERIRSL